MARNALTLVVAVAVLGAAVWGVWFSWLGSAEAQTTATATRSFPNGATVTAGGELTVEIAGVGLWQLRLRDGDNSGGVRL